MIRITCLKLEMNVTRQTVWRAMAFTVQAMSKTNDMFASSQQLESWSTINIDFVKCCPKGVQKFIKPAMVTVK